MGSFYFLVLKLFHFLAVQQVSKILESEIPQGLIKEINRSRWTCEMLVRLQLYGRVEATF